MLIIVISLFSIALDNKRVFHIVHNFSCTVLDMKKTECREVVIYYYIYKPYYDFCCSYNDII